MGLPAPLFVVASAVSAPQHVVPSGLENATDDHLIGVLRSFGGTPPELFEEEGLLPLLVARLRADYCCLASYATRRRVGPLLDVPLFIAGGQGDPIVLREHLYAWREQTASQFTCELFEGGHFFVNEHSSGFAAWLSGVIDEQSSSSRM
ncbi:MAG: thioesterase [Myxococcales bacterium]|nr:thioesterase [Myxococcales bacterium]